MDIRRRSQMGGIKKTSSGSGSTVGSYTVNLNNQWEKTTAIPNPDSTLYDGVYRSSSNYNVNSGVAIMYITIKDCSSFKMYIRSYAESNFDYVMVSQLDQTINGNTSYSSTTLVKAHTRGNQQSGTALSSYMLVEFTGITSGEHTITVVYRKDSSVNNGDDRGYVLIDKTLGSGDNSGDEGGSNGEPINIDNYLTIEALENGLTAKLSNKACEYCVDGDGNWKTLAAGAATESVNAGQTLSFRAELTTSTSGIGTFTISKSCNLKGNCMSLLFGDNAADNYSLSGKNYAFYRLFYNCKTIVNVSENFLPATTLVDYCYDGMFRGCTALKTAPTLPATTLAEGCYRSMFQDCTSLTTAPALPATTLTDNCYYYMFYRCTALTTAPELPATTLASSCYYEMFYYCTSLTTAPTLPATTLTDSCYYYMFRDCASLTTAPVLPATTLAIDCYYFMFYNCTKLNYIKMLATDISASNCLFYWVGNVSSTGTFVKHPDMTTLSIGKDGIPEGWTVVDNEGGISGEPINIDNYLTIEALENGLTASLSINACEYCVDGDSNWKTLAAGTATESVNAGQTLSFRGELTTDVSNVSNGIGTFTISKKCNLKGNCMSMLFGDNANNNYSLEGKDYVFCYLFSNCTNIVNVSSNFLPATTLASECYTRMFYNCTSLTTAPTLPATNLAGGCYANMFEGCTSLINAPTLPATTLVDYCYAGMFSGCTSLTNVPALPVTTLTDGCYNCMFADCTSLTTAPTLPATTLAGGCYGGMFYNCTSLTTAPTLPATTLADGCYDSMFYGCTSLTTAPTLPATTLAYYCYGYMFGGCTSLTTAPALPVTTLADGCYAGMFEDCLALTTAPSLPATTLAIDCYNNMFYNCTSLTTAPALPATTLADYCYGYMFSGCTSLTTAPELPAETLADICYNGMFQGCNNINYIKMLATDISAVDCLSDWLYDVASTGTFVKHPDMTTLPTGVSGIPEGWTVVDNGEE